MAVRPRGGDLCSLRLHPRDRVKRAGSALLFTYLGFWKETILPNASSSQAQGVPQHQGSLPTLVLAINPDVHPQSILCNRRGF